MIYKVVEQRALSRRDIGEVNVIKHHIGEMLTDEVKIKERWREYFSNRFSKDVTNSEEGKSEEAERARVNGAWGKWRYISLRRKRQGN